MTASVTSPADVVNLSLQRIGYKGRVGNLYDGSAAANDALDIYAQTRDELLRQNDWGFAEITQVLTLLKQAPATYIPPTAWDPTLYPPPPWAFEYDYPTNCLKVRAVKTVPLFIPNFDPQPNLWSIANDNTFNPRKRVILCNIASAIMIFTGQITNPVNWDVDFVEAFAAALGRRLAPALVSMEAAKLMVADEAASKQIAEMEQG